MGKKLTVYMIDGNNVGPRTIEIGNWSGKALLSPRSRIAELINRDEFNRPGVYILKSDPNEDIYNERIYIGEAENIKNRLKQHLNNEEKDFKEVVFFISKDELLTKSHIKYIESKLINLAREAKNAEIENGNTPTESTLSEADISDMEYFIEHIKMILPTAGYQFLISNTIKQTEEKSTNSSNIIKKKYIIKNKKYNTVMLDTENGFIVKKDSEANNKLSSSISSGWKKLREKLIKENVLVLKNDKYVFVEDTIFTSPSAASSIVLGRQSAGPNEWIDEQGITYKENEERSIN